MQVGRKTNLNQCCICTEQKRSLYNGFENYYIRHKYNGKIPYCDVFFAVYRFWVQCLMYKYNHQKSTNLWGPDKVPSVINVTEPPKWGDVKSPLLRPLGWSFQKYASLSSFVFHWRQSPIKAKEAQQRMAHFPLYFKEITLIFPKYLRCWFMASVRDHVDLVCVWEWLCVMTSLREQSRGKIEGKNWSM